MHKSENALYKTVVTLVVVVEVVVTLVRKMGAGGNGKTFCFKSQNSLPPEDFMGADKLFAEALFGSINGPLKLGAFRTSRWSLSANG